MGNVIYFCISKSLHGNGLLCFMNPICQFHHVRNFKLEIRSLVPDHLPNPQAVTALSCVVSSVFLNDVLLTSSSLSLHSSDSEGTFETPEAESPGVVKLLGQLDNSNHTGEMAQLFG